MPRIRTIKPEFFRSPSTAGASFPARILFEAMWCWADDYGIGETNINGLLGFAFCDDDGIDAAELQRLLTEVQCNYEVVFYSHRGRYYYAVPTWDEHQKNERRARKMQPLPTDSESTPDLRFQASAQLHGSSVQLCGSSAPGTGEQGNRGTGEERSSSAKPPREDVESLCTHLQERIIANGGRATISEKWRTEARLLIDNDNVELDQAHRLIDWCQADSFWHTNILSMPKFRQQYAQLLMKARASERPPGRGAAGLTPREHEIAQAELLKEHPDEELLRRAGLGPTTHLRAITGGH